MNTNIIGIRIALYLNYFVFAILLNSVGIIIQRSINAYGVTEVQASTLEAFKDLSIAIASFLLGSLLPRLGYKRGMLIGLALVFAGCLGMYLGNSFTAARMLFAVVGVSFAIVKVSVYALIGQVTNDRRALNSLMSSVESVFMVGIAFAYVLFPLFYSDTDPDAWLRIYLFLAIVVAISFFILFSVPFGVSEPVVVSSPAKDFRDMIGLMKLPLVAVFALSAFMYVMTEQGIMSWLPTFNQKVLHLPERLSVNMAVILALSIALGRFLSGLMSKWLSWNVIVTGSLTAAALLVVFVLPMANNLEGRAIESISDIPLIGFVFPLIGLFLAPIYPLVNAAVLGATRKSLHSSMAGLLTFFSAIGGTLGSRLVGQLFETIGGGKAFYFSIIPLTLLVGLVFVLKKLSYQTALNDD